MNRYSLPLEYEVMNLQQIAHRVGWHQGKEQSLLWAVRVLRINYPDAAEFLESLAFDRKTLPGVQSPIGLQPSQHPEGSQAQKNQGPDTSVRWPVQGPSNGHARDH